jgi:hypothetical protein
MPNPERPFELGRSRECFVHSQLGQLFTNRGFPMNADADVLLARAGAALEEAQRLKEQVEDTLDACQRLAALFSPDPERDRHGTQGEIERPALLAQPGR